MLIVGALVLWRFRDRTRLLLLAGLWFFLSLGPVLNIIPTNPVVADRYAYPAVLAFGIVLGVWFQWCLNRSRGALVFIVVFFLAMVGVNFSRGLDWKSDVSLWTAAYGNHQALLGGSHGCAGPQWRSRSATPLKQRT